VPRARVASRADTNPLAALVERFDPTVLDGAEGPPLQAYWLNFARTGDPSTPGLPSWPAYGASGRYLAFTTNGPVVRQGLASAACEHIQRP